MMNNWFISVNPSQFEELKVWFAPTPPNLRLQSTVLYLHLFINYFGVFSINFFLMGGARGGVSADPNFEVKFHDPQNFVLWNVKYVQNMFKVFKRGPKCPKSPFNKNESAEIDSKTGRPICKFVSICFLNSFWKISRNFFPNIFSSFF